MPTSMRGMQDASRMLIMFCRNRRIRVVITWVHSVCKSHPIFYVESSGGSLLYNLEGI